MTISAGPAEMIADPGVPLCFDTSSVFGVRRGPGLLKRVRSRFPDRQLILPAWVVAERVRRLRQEYAGNFDLDLIRTFLNDRALNLQIAAFDRNLALEGWLDVTGGLTGAWGWEGAPQSAQRPCAHRCRSGDYIVAAVAVSRNAILVTEDKALRKEVEEGHFSIPGCCDRAELEASLDIN